MLDWLKEILGESYTEEIDKKVSAEIGKGFVSKSNFDAKNEALKLAQEQLTEANGQIEKFKGMDIEGIQAAADEWKKKAEKAEEDRKNQIASIQFDTMLNSAISSVKGRNAKAIKALLDTDTLKASKNQADDLNKALEALKSENSYLFDDEKPVPTFSGPTPGATSTGMDAIRAAAGLPTETK